MKPNHRRLAMTLLVVFAGLWIWLGIDPRNRQDWLLENVLLVPVFALLIWGWKHRLFSRVSHILIFLFLSLHVVGAHYTYAEVPYDAWTRALTGTALNDWMGWERNHFDRLVHFLYGLLCAYPCREIFLCVAHVRGFWSYFLPLEAMLASSALYELIEWAAAVVFGGELGQAYLGTQGDVWDAQKDMALAGVGSTGRRYDSGRDQSALSAGFCAGVVRESTGGPFGGWVNHKNWVSFWLVRFEASLDDQLKTSWTAVPLPSSVT